MYRGIDPLVVPCRARSRALDPDAPKSPGFTACYLSISSCRRRTHKQPSTSGLWVGFIWKTRSAMRGSQRLGRVWNACGGRRRAAESAQMCAETCSLRCHPGPRPPEVPLGRALQHDLRCHTDMGTMPCARPETRICPPWTTFHPQSPREARARRALCPTSIFGRYP
jgi:hypothetical protein